MRHDTPIVPFMLVAVGIYDRGMVGQGFTFRMPGLSDVPYGAWVRVPMAGKTVRGVVLGPGVEYAEVYDVEAMEQHSLGFRLTRWQCELILWMSGFYFSPLHRVLRLFIPAPLWRGSFQPREQLMVSAAVPVVEVPERQRQVRALVTHLTAKGPVPRESLREEFSTAVYARAKLSAYITEQSLGLIPVRSWPHALEAPRDLTQEQQKIVDKMRYLHPEAGLLYGITGAGKTEIYLHRVLQLREVDKQTALLIPEIALTPQLVAYFQRVLGTRVAIIHSHLAEGEKCQEWLRVARHEVDVVIGSRSAIFAPYAALGQIILDEEHEWTYKNEQNPRYLTHRVAEKISDLAGDVGVLFASGTPSMERLARAREEAPDGAPLTLYVLDKRIYDQTPAG